MLSEAVVPAEPRSVLDGTMYLYFGQGADGAPAAGLSRSPADGTPPAALRDLVLRLQQHVDAPPAERPDTERAIVRASEAVLASARAR
jgi:hypothetical protein